MGKPGNTVANTNTWKFGKSGVPKGRIFKTSQGQRINGPADKQKQAVLREYKKLKRKGKLHSSNDQPNSIYEDEVDDTEGAGQTDFKRKKKAKMSPFHKEDKLRKQKQWQKEQERKEKEVAAKQREEALKCYKQKKRNNYKKIAKVNYKGQPNLAAQMELLLDKIQSTT